MTALGITLDPSSATAPYDQVREQIATQVSDRRLAIGTRLPTVRRLAQDLGLAVNTVARAYRELETAGIVETRGRAGTFVTAAGDGARERLLAEARKYAALARELGLADEALGIVAGALSR
jgi:DNA-binding transcriptional regulator YhcF (GntR family)